MIPNKIPLICFSSKLKHFDLHIEENKHVESVCDDFLSSHLKIDKSKVLMENGSLMKVESIAECSSWSILQYF